MNRLFRVLLKTGWCRATSRKVYSFHGQDKLPANTAWLVPAMLYLAGCDNTAKPHMEESTRWIRAEKVSSRRS